MESEQDVDNQKEIENAVLQVELFQEKENCIKELRMCLVEFEKNEKLLENFKSCKAENVELQQQQMQNEETQQKIKHTFVMCYEELQEQEVFLSELRQYIRKLETQNKYLISENAECRRKLSIITDTKIGQLCIKVYHLLKRIKRKLFGRK